MINPISSNAITQQPATPEIKPQAPPAPAQKPDTIQLSAAATAALAAGDVDHDGDSH